jgi:hypothetical protein
VSFINKKDHLPDEFVESEQSIDAEFEVFFAKKQPFYSARNTQSDRSIKTPNNGQS